MLLPRAVTLSPAVTGGSGCCELLLPGEVVVLCSDGGPDGGLLWYLRCVSTVWYCGVCGVLLSTCGVVRGVTVEVVCCGVVKHVEGVLLE